MKKGSSAKSKIKDFFLRNINVVVSNREIQQAAGSGVTEWARRVRELREQEKWKIMTHNDLEALSPGQYMLIEKPPANPPIIFEDSISAKLRAEVFDRNGFTCQSCGLCPGDIDPYTNRKVRLHVGHIKDRSLGGKAELSNLRTLCSTCNQGAKNITAVKPDAIWLISQVRRAGVAEQKEVFSWLSRKFATDKI